MKPNLTPYLLSGLLAVAGLPLLAETAPKPRLQVDLSATGKPISPDLFGIFFEDINYAADGGLYGELIQNRSFESNATEQRDWNEFTGWITVAREGGEGSVAVRSSKPVHLNNPHYISIEVKSSAGAFGVANSGYDGIPVQANEAYEVSFFAHQLFMNEAWGEHAAIEGHPMPVTVKLETESGDVLAQSTASIAGRDWTKQTLRLVPARTETKARLVILADAKGGVALDEISLFPEHTFRNRKNGLRADIAQTIADLKPKFIRFPGGCVAHGDGLSNVYHWKNTVGPVEQRRGQRNLWGYHQSVGLGYFEYFQFCEDIGAKPLPIVAAGVSCQFSDASPWHGQQCLPLADIAAYTQDVLDLIEWANGPATSRWGAVRAAAGHPQPFGLKYLGLGNEDGITPEFQERFKAIYDVIRAKHPEIVIIGTVGAAPDGPEFERGWSFGRSLGIPMLDEHYYKSPEWFWENQHRYDNYDRKGPKVYAGEYAAHEKDRRNTLRAALAEGAACLSFERNGDVVSLASYAPLLARRGHTQWTPDMIYFDATKVYPSINYQVQRLFCINMGDTGFSAKFEGVQPTDRVAWSVVRDSASGDVIVKIINGEERALVASVDLGSPAGRRRLIATVLTGANADVANEDGKEPAAKPVMDESTVNAVFERAFPANSLTVLRLSKL